MGSSIHTIFCSFFLKNILFLKKQTNPIPQRKAKQSLSFSPQVGLPRTGSLGLRCALWLGEHAGTCMEPSLAAVASAPPCSTGPAWQVQRCQPGAERLGSGSSVRPSSNALCQPGAERLGSGPSVRPSVQQCPLPAARVLCVRPPRARVRTRA